MLIALCVAGALSAGPELEDKAVAVDLAVDKVMVFSDRARVVRSGHVKFAGGILRAPDLPGAAMLDSVRVTAAGAKVVRVETRPVQRERFSIEQVDAWLADLEKIGDRIALAQNKLQVVRNELNLLSNLDVAPPVAEKDRLGKPPAVLAPDAWRALQDHLAQRRAQARVTEKNLERELRDLDRDYDQARREVQARNIGGFTDQKIEVLVVVDPQQAEGELSVEYAVPGASWRPAYDLDFEPDQNKVTLQASGLVSQASGEDWPKAHVQLSTAIPGQGIALPKLETWTLGDDREWMPRASAKNPPRTTHPFQPPAAKPRLEDLEREADRAVLSARTSQLVSLAATQKAPPVTTSPTTIDFTDDTIEGELVRPDSANLDARRQAGRGAGMPSRAPPPPPPASYPSSAPSAAPAPMREEMDESGVTETAESAPGAFQKAAGVVGDAISSVTRGPPTSYRAMSVGAENIPQRQQFGDPMLPAVSAGGLDYVYDAPVAVSVPSQANQLRVPLAARTYEVTTFYEATPALATTAFLKATVKNGSKLPILAGPANIFVKRAFAGDAVLATTGPGGVLELPLGADEDIRLTRTVVPSTKTQGFLIGQEDVTEYAVTIDVGNYKKHAVTVRVIDQIPKTNVEKIKVELMSSSPQTVEAPNGEGVVYWHVDIPAGGTKKVTFTYRVTRPKDWRLSQ